MVDYQGQRTSMELAAFATQQHTLAMIKGKVGDAVNSVKAVGKLAMSKVLGRGGGVQPAQQPAAAAAA